MSRSLLLRNLAFPFVNFSFTISLGIVYWVAALILGSALSAAHPASGKEWAAGTASALFHSPVLWITAVVLFAVLWIYADARTPAGKRWLGLTHAAAHLVMMLALVSFLPPLNARQSNDLVPLSPSPSWLDCTTIRPDMIFGKDTHRFRPPTIFLAGSLVWKAEATTTTGVGSLPRST